MVYYNYASTGVGAPLSRLDNIADDDDSPTDTYAEYEYLGASTVVKVEYPAVTDTLALTYGASGSSYPGFDRFGRVVDQKWQIESGPTVKDRYTYGYDYTSNRMSRDVAADMGTPPTGLDDYYEYDGLNRLTQSNRGDLVSGVIDEDDADENQAWTLDEVGNWSQFKWDDDGGADDWVTQTRTHNKANEITDTNADWLDPAYNLAGNMTEGPKPGDETDDGELQFYTYDAWNRLVKVVRKSGDTINPVRHSVCSQCMLS